jgi:hypothetical protein
MKITSIRFEQLKSGPGYENQKVGVEVAIDDGESPEAAMDVARRFVSKELGRSCPPDESTMLAAVARKLRDLAEKAENESLPF